MKKKAWLFVLLLTIITSLVTGTYAVYTKSFVFNGNITKVSNVTPPPPADDEDIISDPTGTEDKPDVEKNENGDVSINKRGDYLQLVTLPGDEYKVEVDISNYKKLHAFGVYVDGYYDEESHTVYADVVQIVNGNIEMKRRSFVRSYDANGKLIVTEGDETTYSSIATAADTFSILPDVPESLHMTIIITTKTDKKGTLVKVPEVYLNDMLVPNQKYPTREILHTGNKAYVGYRSWYGGDPNVLFQNLKVSSLKEEAPDIPDVIIPSVDGGEGNPNIAVNGGEVTITNAGDYLYAVDGIEDSYVISSYVQVNASTQDGLKDHLKGFGIYIDGGGSASGAVDADCLYFTNMGETNEMRLTSFSMLPALLNDQWVFDRVSRGDDVKVTTQGESGLEWNDARNGFYLFAAVKGNSDGTKQVRVFTANKNMQQFREVSQYYGTPWTGNPPIRPSYRTNSRIYVGYHADNDDSRKIIYRDLQVTNGLDRIPSDLLNKYGW